MIADIITKVAGMELEERGKYYPRPSVCGPERCIRQMVYWASQVPEDKKMGERFILTLDDSSWHETLTADWIQKTAYQLHSSQLAVDLPVVSFTDNLDAFPAHACHVKNCNAFIPIGTLHGHIDGLLTDLMLEEILFEHKALNHFSFNRYATGEVFPLDYITQSSIYTRAVQYLNPNITKALLCIKNKNTSQYLEMLIHYDKDTDTATIYEVLLSTGERTARKDGSPLLVVKSIVGEAVRKLVAVYEYSQKKKLPPRPYDYGTEFPCGYCSWEQTCWAGYEQEVEALANNDADLSEIADTARFYNELGAQLTDMKAQRDEIGKTIKTKLAEHQARHGRAGEYNIELRLVKRAGYTVADSMSEQLFVRKFKAKKEKAR